MGIYKVEYRVGARYGRGYWQTEEFDNRADAVRFRDRKCREGKDAKIIEEPAKVEKWRIDTSKTVEKYCDKLFSGGPDLHLL